jgi:hypothetical protein
METSARLSKKGQVHRSPRGPRSTVPRRRRSRCLPGRGWMCGPTRTPNLLALAGSISVPAAKRGTPWAEVLQRTRQARVATRR